ncbi:MAG: Sensor histidine kinase RcsC [Syntrophus sp. SKADARSKE-3]|nr:Sensor histidine kinase RcsC [Syntrophus sp. SKADARSKE-3]
MIEKDPHAKQLSDELALLQRCISGSPIPAFVIGKDRKLIYWNRALEELSQIRADEVIGTSQHWRAFYGEERPCLADLLVSDTLQEIPQWYLGKYTKSNLITDAYEATDFFPELGQRGRWLRFTAALIRDSQGDAIGAIETLEDITGRKEAEQALLTAHEDLELRVRERTAELARTNEALQRTTDHLSLILESLPIVSYARKAAGNLDFTYVSNAIEEITGYPASAFTEDAAFWQSRIHPNDKQNVLKMFRNSKKKIYGCEYRFLAADDTYRWFSDYWRVIQWPDNPDSHIVGVWQNITEEKRIRQESELRLQQMIHTDKLTALGEVVAGVAHEINNPVSFISYNIPLLEEIWNSVDEVLAENVDNHPSWDKRGMNREDIANHMREIIHAFKIASSRISRVITGLKEFSRTDEIIRMNPLSVSDIIEGALVIVGAQVRKTVSSILIHIDPDLPQIHGHFQRLEQVMTNLLINAHQSIPPGQKGRITITARHVKRLRAVVIAVEDNGRGMTKEIQDHLFHPFFTTRRDSGGTGLGLSISYGIVKEHRGLIGILSQPGLGTRFTLFLPAGEADMVKVSPGILCIDDDEIFLKELATNLPDARIIHASIDDDAGKIIRYLLDHPEIDIVLSEVMLPGINGWDLLREISEQFRLLNVILYSADSTDCEAPQDMIGKARCIMMKPFNIDKLQIIIREIGRQRL